MRKPENSDVRIPRPRVRVVVCADHRAFREALGAYLSQRPGIGSVTLAADADEAMRAVRPSADVLIVDVFLGGESSSLELVEAVHNLGLHVAVLILGESTPTGTISRALELGAAGFCPRDVPGDVLHDAILAVAQGELFLPDTLVAPVTAELGERRRREAEHRQLLMRLTPRERDVLRLLADGRRRDDIARRLSISPNTVRTRLGSIMDKLGVHSQVAAAALGRQLFDLQPAPDHATGVPDVES